MKKVEHSDFAFRLREFKMKYRKSVEGRAEVFRS